MKIELDTMAVGLIVPRPSRKSLKNYE